MTLAPCAPSDSNASMTTVDDTRAATSRAAADALDGARPALSSLRAVVGFDAMVDTIARVVDTKSLEKGPTPMRRIEQLADRVAKAAGRSINIEILAERVKVGGNGALMADALGVLGAKVAFLGNAGAQEGDGPHEVFADFAQRMDRAILVGPPGMTDALEFDDGKIMLGKTTNLERIRWSALLDAAGGEDGMTRLLDGASLLAPVSWTQVPHMDEIWDGLASLLPRVRESRRPSIFIDLADPAKRTEDALARALDRLRRLGSLAPLTLGLNLSECKRVARSLGAKEPGSIEDGAPIIREAMGVDCVATHEHRAGAAATADDHAHFRGPYVREPEMSTGAGDHFNAGFSLARALGLPLDQSLAAAAGVSGWYVRKGACPSIDDLVGFLRDLPKPEQGG